MSPQKRSRYPILLFLGCLAVAAMAGFSIAKLRVLTAPGKLQTVSNLGQDNVSPDRVTQDNLTQDDDDDSENNEVPPAQVEQYLKVYQSMQSNRSMTIDQATAQQHMTVDQFRDIEARIEKDGVLRERVRRELLKMAQEKSNALKLKPQSAPSSSTP
jgi:hypothetical protein